MTEQRLLPIQQGTNFRELGGYKNLDGQSIKWHKLIRSGKLNELTEQDLEFLRNYGLQYDIDFRSPEERSKSPDRVPEGVQYSFNPVFSVDETQSSKQTELLQRKMRIDPTIGRTEMQKVYVDLVKNPHAQKAYRTFFDQLLANSAEDSALLFHCTAGKDRTGMGAVFLLNALNIDEDTIRADYLLTNRASKSVVDAMTKSLKIKNSSAAFIQSMQALQSVHISYYNTAMHEINQISGNVHNYMNEYLKVSDSEIKDLQKIYLN
ncbi:tyrosine-protein phosphatase [Pediococcus argentinicus]|uniref:tyrosine-protein phosphatase n=1 Tax=Pediococcus argentinicus TaxID=480391 RepID=UPI00338FA1A7